MGVRSQANEALKILVNKVQITCLKENVERTIIITLYFINNFISIIKQVLMMNKDNEAKGFKQLEFDDKDLVMFTITDLRLEKRKEQVHMVINLKRKIQTELLTTYLPTVLLLIVSYATTFFKPIYFEASLTVNLTIMLVMTTIFTSKIEELPPTSDTKMIDIWLIFCNLVPFAFTLIQTAIESYREEDERSTVGLKRRPEEGSQV